LLRSTPASTATPCSGEHGPFAGRRKPLQRALTAAERALPAKWLDEIAVDAC
jgi:hypothetical protein